ncbi:unnamed protein product, partial [Discosporangium mesarthrocarpum]
MALVDTQGLELAVDRSLFGPQGRRWIERKLPEVVMKMSFITVSGMGAVLLMFHICLDYQRLGLKAIFYSLKHLTNAMVLHFVVRLLRWHLHKLIMGRNYLPTDEVLPSLFRRESWNSREKEGEVKSIPWPWQQHQQAPKTSSWAGPSK